ncbi:hypothetical protein M431DRAFT_448691 [Trichoderma harzianum CBS 226.95]|uniref:Uncharacterized protein n=1 Tax=Trichoderma harzianum CBS 226.95 TaxID=983964 RepID=A0A2T4AAR4_TRIHA|nr:hypothetical protein M431DRAFT_448691 [Trichoderma harzianum CBS 226.95]PTB54008.1 hypothetical protein M431DRAFT_448691 [Trichoderma harzianum CBS 226.95]
MYQSSPVIACFCPFYFAYLANLKLITYIRMLADIDSCPTKRASSDLSSQYIPVTLTIYHSKASFTKSNMISVN